MMQCFQFVRNFFSPAGRAIPSLARIALALCLAAVPAHAAPSPSIGIWDDVSGLPEFTHLAHVDPDAPKGGSVRFGVVGTYDNFNPFSARGLCAAYMNLTYETLGETDREHGTLMHGLLAESFDLAEDRLSLVVALRPQARFHDGTPVDAEDLVFTFRALVRDASPQYRSYYAGVREVTALDERRVRFDFFDAASRELPMIVAQLPVLPRRWWEGRHLGEPRKEVPPGSGPYKVAKARPGSSLTLERDLGWWGADLPINRGRYNFDTIQVDYYRDKAISREAFFAGEIDCFIENTIKDWMKSYDVPPVKDGRIVRSEIEEHSIRPFSGLFLNTRSPLLGDKNIREALTLLFDFEWTNRALFYDKYLRCVSFFPNSPLAAPDVPDAAELALLEPWRDRIDPAVLGPLPELPETDGSGAIRPLLRRALALFEKSGWKLADGVLRNAAGEPMRLAFPLVSPAQQRIVVPYQKNLAQIGIRLDVRLVDQTQYVNRVRSFDFDIIIASLRQSESPGNEQRNFWSSEAARQEGSRNYAGIGDPVVDAMVERLIAAATFEELTAATRALDRLLRHGRYVVPGWYSKHTRIAWWRERITPPPDRPKRGLDWTSWYAAPRALPPRAADGGR